MGSPRSEDDTVGDLKKMVAAQTGTRADKIRIQKWCGLPYCPRPRTPSVLHTRNALAKGPSQLCTNLQWDC